MSSNILKSVPLNLRPCLKTRSLSEYLRKCAIIVRPPLALSLFGFPSLYTQWNSTLLAFSISSTFSRKSTRTSVVPPLELDAALSWGASAIPSNLTAFFLFQCTFFYIYIKVRKAGPFIPTSKIKYKSILKNTLKLQFMETRSKITKHCHYHFQYQVQVHTKVAKVQ